MTKGKQKLECENCESRGKGVFCHLEELALSELSEAKVTNVYKRGHSLFLEGNPPFGLYCINSGKVKLTKTGSDGSESIVRIASSGDLLGHRSLFSNSPYAASAIVIEEARICFINKKIIHTLIARNPALAFEVIGKLSAEMGKAESWIASLSQKNVRERFAEMLLILKQTFGVEEVGKGTKLDVKLTREEFASMIGTAPESLIRLVTEFKDDGLISQDGKTLYILNEPKLLEYAGIGE